MMLILGRRGMLATALYRELCRRDTSASFIGGTELDLSKPGAVSDIILDYTPTAVINAAAYTAVDRAESEIEAAIALNATMPGEAAHACRKLNIPLVNVSTDYVFDGAKGEPYREEDAPSPLNAYGRSKLEGEQAVADSGAAAVSIRTSWVLGPSPRNFIATMLRLARDRDEITVVDDQWGRATLVEDLAQGCLAICEDLGMGGEFKNDVVHLSGPRDMTWAHLARAIMEEAATQDLPVADIVPISSQAFGAAARRPLDSRLDSSRYQQRYSCQTRDWADELPSLISSINALI